MIYILTGDDTAASRNKLTELLEGISDVAQINGKKQNIAEVEMSLRSNALFSSKRAVIIEYFSKIKSDKFTQILKPFETDELTSVILWDEQDLSAKIKNSLKKAQIFSFIFPKVYFAFMDGLIPSNSKNSLKLLREVLKNYEPEQILYSIIKRIRQLIVLKSENFAEFEEFSKMQDWQIGKLRAQSNKWSETQLKKAFLEYVELDEKIKTGGLTMSLPKHLDILIASDLN